MEIKNYIGYNKKDEVVKVREVVEVQQLENLQMYYATERNGVNVYANYKGVFFFLLWVDFETFKNNESLERVKTIFHSDEAIKEYLINSATNVTIRVLKEAGEDTAVAEQIYQEKKEKRLKEFEEWQEQEKKKYKEKEEQERIKRIEKVRKEFIDNSGVFTRDLIFVAEEFGVNIPARTKGVLLSMEWNCVRFKENTIINAPKKVRQDLVDRLCEIYEEVKKRIENID